MRDIRLCVCSSNSVCLAGSTDTRQVFKFGCLLTVQYGATQYHWARDDDGDLGRSHILEGDLRISTHVFEGGRGQRWGARQGGLRGHEHQGTSEQLHLPTTEYHD